mmetsp:Transcript_49647/g.115101  ORF Transcript_49647/g.115101 Transcript_49647/m.115101 type:complete len:480 (+) Transcript_49647:72-1511(+)
MYNNPNGGPFLPSTGRAPPGVASSPKNLGGGGHGGSFAHPANASFSTNGAGPGGSFNHAGPGASPSFQAQQASGSFQVPSNGASFQVPNTAGNNSGSFTGVGSFGHRLPQHTASFTGPPLLTNPAGSPPPHLKGGPAPAPGSFEDVAAANSVTRPLNPGPHFVASTHGSKAECQDQQCAEEECDPQECGDENRAPQDERYLCGLVSRRPLLPFGLVTSTITGATHMVLLQFPILREMCDGACLIRVFFLILYAMTLGCMAYCVYCNAGELKREDHRKAYARLQQASGGTPMSGCAAELEDPPLPKRCHKTWQYTLPIRRYDHYCRWLTNCIGLLNHREFIVMVAGLVMIGVSGALLDFFLVITTAREGRHWLVAFFLALHLAYSVILVSLAGPIFRLHVGFISRNELANEWKRNDFYVITNARTGKRVPVNDLDDDEFNDHFDAFEYDKKRNTFDKDLVSNCWAFWCTPRWTPGQLGEF